MDNSNSQQPTIPTVAQPAEVAPSQPVASSTGGDPSQQVGQPYQMPPKKGLSTGAIWGIIGGVIGLILLIVGVVIVIVMTAGPSKDDYRKAAKYLREFTVSVYDDHLSAKTENEAKNKKEEFFKKGDEHFKKLGSDKVMRDPEVKKAFEAYEAEWNKAKPIVENIIDLDVAYGEVSRKCDVSKNYVSTYEKTAEQVGKEFDSKNGECMKALEKAKDSKISLLAEYANKHYDYLKDYREYQVKSAELYASRDYSSSYPNMPKYPSVSSPKSKILDDLMDVKLTERSLNLSDLLYKKSK